MSGDMHVRLNPASAPRRSRALAAPCTELIDTRYPGADLTCLPRQKAAVTRKIELTMSGGLVSTTPPEAHTRTAAIYESAFEPVARYQQLLHQGGAAHIDI